jgi:hypothetical protein
VSEEKGPRPAVYARLRHDEEARIHQRAPSRVARWVGWALILAIVIVVAWAVVEQASP